MTVANKMRLYGEDMKDVKVVEKLLRSLDEKFDYVICSIEESKDIDALTIDELQGLLIVREYTFLSRLWKWHMTEKEVVVMVHTKEEEEGEVEQVLINCRMLPMS